MDLLVLPRARRDIEDVVDYYASVSPGLAARFNRDLISTLGQVRRQPLIGSAQYERYRKGLRVWRLRKFPYNTFYLPLMTRIEVLRVLHERRQVSRQSFVS